MLKQKKDEVEIPATVTNKKSSIKIILIALGTVIGISHLGLLGYVLKDNTPTVKQIPTINIPKGPYSSYRIKADKDGYEIEYRANDPAVLESEKTLELDKSRRGFFGGGTEKRNEYRRDQYTMEGDKNMRGVITKEGKSAEDIECLISDAGARSQGAMAGSAITAGILTPAVMNIPYIGWLAAGWVSLLGTQTGETLGSEISSVFNDC